MFYFPNCFDDNTSVCFVLRLLIKQTTFAYKYRRQYDDLRHLNTKYCLKFIRSQCSWHYSVGYEFSVDFSNLMRQSLIRSLTILPPNAIGVKHFHTQFLPLIKILSIIFSFLKYCIFPSFAPLPLTFCPAGLHLILARSISLSYPIRPVFLLAFCSALSLINMFEQNNPHVAISCNTSNP